METQQQVDITFAPLGRLLDLWGWLREYPEANFDDYGPKDFGEFRRQMTERVKTEDVIGVWNGDELIGAFSYLPLTPRSGMLHGLCFSRAVHGTGIAAAAMQKFLNGLWANGIEKISAQYFADNKRVQGFFKKLGAVDEGYLQAHTVRNGVPLDVRMIALFPPKEVS